MKSYISSSPRVHIAISLPDRRRARVPCRVNSPVRSLVFTSPRTSSHRITRDSEGNDFESAAARRFVYRRCLTIAECALPCKDLRALRAEGLPGRTCLHHGG